MADTVAVTGATGFIGQALCRQLLNEGFRVRALVRKPSDAEHLAQLGVELCEGSLSDLDSLNSLCRDANALIHCAGAVRGSCQADFDKVNVSGLETLLAAIGQCHQAPRLLCLSSLAAREPELSFYAKSKHRSEQLLQRQADTLAWTAIRPPAVYGPGDTELLPLFKTMARGIMPVPGSSTARLSIIHVDDLVSAIIAWLNSGQDLRQVVSVEDGRKQGYSWQEIAATVSAITKRPVRLVKVPAWLLNSLAWCNRYCSRLLRYAPMLTPEKLRELRHENWVSDSTVFSESVGWQPQITLEQGLRQTPGWR